MYNMAEKKFIDLTPEVAERLLKINTYVAQRPIRFSWVNTLAERIKTGEFHTGDLGIAIMRNRSDEEILVNGQHQCRAVIEAGIPIPVIIKYFDCFRGSDLSKLFGNFDSQPGRSFTMMANAVAKGMGIHWPQYVSSLVASAAAYIEYPKQALYKNAKAELLSKYVREGEFINNILNVSVEGIAKRHTAHMRRRAVVASMIASWQIDRNDAEIFWTDVRDGVMLSKIDPAYKLRLYLTADLQKKKHNKFRLSFTRWNSDNDIVDHCVRAWNTFRSGKALNAEPIQGQLISDIQ